MRSLAVPSVRAIQFCHRIACPRFAAAVMTALLAATGPVGCDEASGPDMPTMPSGIVIPKTPEEKLDRVMERMRSALQDAQAASGTGVISERTCDYQLIPPASEGGQYTAEVTIKTKLSLAKAPAAATLPPPEEEEGAETEDESADVEGEEPGPDNGVTRKAVAQSRDFRTDVYQLAYEGDRWKLLTKPKGETDQLILDYALNL